MHDVEPPRWVQKQRQRDPADTDTGPLYEEPRRATIVAVNTKFSMFATGTHRYANHAITARRGCVYTVLD